MNRIFCLTIALVMLLFHLKAQEVKYGFRAGTNFSNWSGNSENMDYNPIIGFHAGPFVSISANELISYELGLYFSRKGTESSRSFEGVDEDDYIFIENKNNCIITYLDFPILARLTLFKGLNVHVGPQFSLLLSKKATKEQLFIRDDKKDIYEIVDKDITMFNKFDLGIVAGVGYQLENGININVSYDYGLYKIYKEKGFPEVRNRVIKASLGYLF